MIVALNSLDLIWLSDFILLTNKSLSWKSFVLSDDVKAAKKLENKELKCFEVWLTTYQSTRCSVSKITLFQCMRKVSKTWKKQTTKRKKNLVFVFVVFNFSGCEEDECNGSLTSSSSSSFSSGVLSPQHNFLSHSTQVNSGEQKQHDANANAVLPFIGLTGSMFIFNLNWSTRRKLSSAPMWHHFKRQTKRRIYQFTDHSHTHTQTCVFSLFCSFCHIVQILSNKQKTHLRPSEPNWSCAGPCGFLWGPEGFGWALWVSVSVALV